MAAVMRPTTSAGFRSSTRHRPAWWPVWGRAELQRTLWVCAKRSPERRFHALYDRIWRSDVLREAWKRVKGNRGRPALTVRRWPRSRRMASSGCSASFSCASSRGIVRRRFGAWRSRSQMVAAGRWVSRRCVIASFSRRRGWCWSRSSRPTFWRFRSVSAKAFGDWMPRSASGSPFRAGACGSGGRHPRLLRPYRSAEVAGAGRRAGLGSAGAQAAATVAPGGCDGGRGVRGDGLRDAAGRRDLAAVVEHLPARLRSRDDRARHRRTRSLCG